MVVSSAGSAAAVVKVALALDFQRLQRCHAGISGALTHSTLALVL